MKRIRMVLSAVFLFQCLVSARAYSGTKFVTVATDDRGIVLEFNASGYGFMDVLEDETPCTKVTLPGATVDSRPGLPVLPLKSTWIAVPQGEPPSVTVLNVAFETRQDAWVALGPGPAGSGNAAEGSAPERILRNEAVLGPDAWFPGSLVEVKPEGLLRWLPVARLTVHPVQVLPTLGQARSYSRFRFHVDFAGVPERRVRQAGELASDAYDSALSKEVVNGDAVTVVEEDPTALDFPGSAEDPLSAFTVMEDVASGGRKIHRHECLLAVVGDGTGCSHGQEGSRTPIRLTGTTMEPETPATGPKTPRVGAPPPRRPGFRGKPPGKTPRGSSVTSFPWFRPFSCSVYSRVSAAGEPDDAAFQDSVTHPCVDGWLSEAFYPLPDPEHSSPRKPEKSIPSEQP